MRVRAIPAEKITAAVSRLCIEANTVLGDNAVAEAETSLAIEESPVGRGLFRKEIDVAHFTGLAIKGKFFWLATRSLKGGRQRGVRPYGHLRTGLR
jgi:hypothetical protein